MSEDTNMRVCMGCDYVRNVGYMEGLTEKIVSELPVDCLLEFKLVSKFWYKLITEPTFDQLQFDCAPKDPKLILHLGSQDSNTDEDLFLMDRDGVVSEYVSLPYLEEDSSLKLLCSFNGLVFCTKSVGEDELGIQVVNPATQEVLEIPGTSPSEITESVGVLFDTKKNGYKIFRFLYDESESNDNSNCKCEVYTPDTREWRKISGIVKGPVPNLLSHLFPSHVCVGGIMYWLVWSEEDIEVPGYILSIDMDENITRVELPTIVISDEPGGGDVQMVDAITFNILTFLTEYEGSLACVSVDDDESNVYIWLLTDHGKSTWCGKGGAPLLIDASLGGINSIVSVDKELLFILNPDMENHFFFHFLNVEEMTWRISCEGVFKIGECEPFVLPYAESLFRCDFRQVTSEARERLIKIENDVNGNS
ncbi:hypothetical protein ABFS82_13G173300 [Erythranthe guttata]|nr:PREDICTED: putative F-box protein At3g10430 isoform X2 [Erythranthe guttata]|eukprot:XP_012827541.1 PREDICTED: putative F-box protein At3g10430 isoform X2 [Erythranthe guttata]